MDAKTKPQPQTRKRATLDLSALDNPIGVAPTQTDHQATIPSNQVNAVLMLNLSEVIEDPGQPRTEFSEESLNELADDIRLRGVMQPILVRPKKDGKYQVIQGARRFRASQIAGHESIRAIVEKDINVFDDYSQVAENIKREALAAMDLARFIQKRLEAKDTQVEIAKKLGLTPARISEIYSLLKAPIEIQNALQDGRINDAKAAYELKKLQEHSPEKAAALLESGEVVTQNAIANAKKEINVKTAPEPQPSTEKTEKEKDENEGNGDEEKITHTPYHNPALDEKDTGSLMVRDPAKVSRPLILGQVKDDLGEVRSVKIVWSKLANSGLVNIQWEDTMMEEVVAATRITLTFVGSMRQQEK